MILIRINFLNRALKVAIKDVKTKFSEAKTINNIFGKTD